MIKLNLYMDEDRQKLLTKKHKEEKGQIEEDSELMLESFQNIDCGSDSEDIMQPITDDGSEPISCIKDLLYEETNSDSSSENESEFEYFDFTDHRQAISALTKKVRFDFIKRISENNRKKDENLVYKPLNSYISLSKSLKLEDAYEEKDFQGTTQRNFDPNSLGKNKKDYNQTEPRRHRSASFSLSANLLKEHIIYAEPERRSNVEGITSKSSKKVNLLSGRFQFKQTKNDSKTSSSFFRRFPMMPSTSTDPPKNALVLYWGRITMTIKELKDLYLSRCIKGLLEEDHYEFVLLKALSTKLVLQYCDTSHTDFPDKNFIKHRKKSITEMLFNSKKDVPRDPKYLQQNRENKKSSINSLLSCVGSSHNSFKYNQLLQHNDSLCLRSYDIMRRKKLLEFDYRKIVYCGTEERDIPNNMIMWIYHSEHGQYNAVECYCVECDDRSHAKKLSRAIATEILKSN